MYAELTILGNNSAAPTKTRNQSGQHFKLEQDQVLLDCGEGTQKRLILNRINYQKITYILISHLHGDHFLGLMGLLNTMALNGRKSKITIVSPSGLQRLYTVYTEVSDAHQTFEIDFVELAGEKQHTIDTERLSIKAIPVSHRIACFAYIIERVFTMRSINQPACESHSIPISVYPNLKAGEDYTDELGQTINNSLLTYFPPNPITYGYITDTLYQPELATEFAHCHTVYHEATYLHNLIDRAIKTKHSTALQAGEFAQKASVNQLLIGHFSSRYHSTEGHLAEARQHFENTHIAEEGQTFEIY
ncbi:MAG: ribonuclease Z [Bacteroidia bacterium]|jgi:ribonuclease Z